MVDNEVVSLKVWSDLACFTRPEMKVERVSYPLMTPSAARGVLESILWKPEFCWYVRRITVLKPIRYMSIRRNEVQDRIATNNVQKWMADPTTFEPYLADSAGRHDVQGENRTQRNTLALRDVAYLIEASIEVPNGFSRSNPPIKYREMFERRVTRGQCFQQPYLGIREFAACFARPDGTEAPPDGLRLNEAHDLGLMLFDIDYTSQSHRPLFAEATLRHGVLDVEVMRETATAQEVTP